MLAVNRMLHLRFSLRDGGPFSCRLILGWGTHKGAAMRGVYLVDEDGGETYWGNHFELRLRRRRWLDCRDWAYLMRGERSHSRAVDV